MENERIIRNVLKEKSSSATNEGGSSYTRNEFSKRRKDLRAASLDWSTMLSDECIINCNRIFWLKEEVMEAKKKMGNWKANGG